MSKLINLDNLTRYDNKIKTYINNNSGNYNGIQHHSSATSSDIGTGSSKRLHLSELSIGKHLFTNSGATSTLYYDYISDGSGSTPTTSTGSKSMYDVRNSSVYSLMYEVEMFIDISGGVKGNTSSGDVVGVITWYPRHPSTSTNDIVKYKIYVSNTSTGTLSIESYTYIGSGYAVHSASNSASGAYSMANSNALAISALDTRVSALEASGGGEQQFGDDILVFWNNGFSIYSPSSFYETKPYGTGGVSYTCYIEASLDFSKSSYLQLSVHTDDMYGRVWDTLDLSNAHIDLYSAAMDPAERTWIASFDFGDLTISPVPTAVMSYTSSIMSTDPSIPSASYYARLVYGDGPDSGTSVEQKPFAEFVKESSGSYYIDWDSLSALEYGTYILTLFPGEIPDLYNLYLTNGGQSLQDSFSYTTLTCIFTRNAPGSYFRGQLTISGAQLSYQYILYCESPSGNYYVSGKKVQMTNL